jgi:hypothetical protein
MVPHETVWGMRQARSPAFWGVPIGVYRMTGDEGHEGYVTATSDCQKDGAVPLYRLYHSTRDKHFYTADPAERVYAKDNLGFRDEGVMGYSMPNHATGTTPLYRLYHSETDNHFYTVNKAERDQVVNKYDYRDEGPAAYVFTDQSLFPPENACLKPLLRYWHAGLRRHRYTIDHNDLVHVPENHPAYHITSGRPRYVH